MKNTALILSLLMSFGMVTLSHATNIHCPAPGNLRVWDPNEANSKVTASDAANAEVVFSSERKIQTRFVAGARLTRIYHAPVGSPLNDGAHPKIVCEYNNFTLKAITQRACAIAGAAAHNGMTSLACNSRDTCFITCH